MKNEYGETVTLAKERADGIRVHFIEEVERLLKSGAVDPEKYSRQVVFRVALENVLERMRINWKDNEEYHNLKRF